MKGALAAALVAIAETAHRRRRPVVLLGSYAEEIGCHGAEALVAERGLLGDVTGAVCLVGEPTGLQPIVGHKGYGGVELSLHGRAAHSSDPWAGADASVALAALLVELHALREDLRRRADPRCEHRPPCTTLNTGLVSAGRARNVVPDEALVVLELRPLPGEDEERLHADVAACLERACAAAPGVTGSLRWQERRPPFAQDPRHALVAWLAGRTGQVPGQVAFYTEAELYRRGLGLPTVVCGPGSIEQAHREDESLAFDELLAGQQLYAEAIDAFCG